MTATTEPIIVGLDIGSSKIAALAVTYDAEGMLTFAEAARVPAEGIRGGVVTSIPEATDSLARAVGALEEKLERRIAGACLSVGGQHLSGQNVRGAAAITPRGRDIGHEDVVRAIASARAALPRGENREVLHEIPRAYLVDGQAGVRDPHGMSGNELEVEVHYATGAATMLHNVLKCVRQANVRPDLVVAAPLATGEAVRDAYSDIRCLAVLDIGEETAKLAIYVSGAIWLSAVLPAGGIRFTQAIATRLRLPLPAAEDLKVWHGHCDSLSVGGSELVEMPDAAGVEALVPRSEVAAALADEADRFASELRRWLDEVRRSGVEPEMLLLAGGGALLPGLDVILMQELDLSVQRGIAGGIHGLPRLLEGPSYTTVAGLVLWYARYAADETLAPGVRRRALPKMMHGLRGIMRVVMP